MPAAPSDTPAVSPRNEWQTYRRLLRYTRPYALRLVVGAAFCFLSAGSSAGLILGVRRFFEEVFNPLEKPFSIVLTAALALVLLGLLRGLGDYGGRYLIEWVGNRVVMDLRTAIYRRIQTLSMAFFTHSRTGELLSRMANDTALVERAVAQVLTDLFKQPIVLIGAVGMLFWLNPTLATLSVVVFPICILPIAIFGRRVRKAAREGQKRLADLTSIAQEGIAGARIVRAFGMEEYEIGRFRAVCGGVFRRVMQVTRAKVAVEPIIVELGIVGVSLVLLYAWHSKMSIGDFFAFALALMMMYDPVKKLGNIHVAIQHSSAAADRIFEIVDTEISVPEKSDACVFDGEVQQVAFEDVAFSYGGEPVLEQISLSVRRGQRLALVGSSGSGKTTLVSLIPRFFDVTAGRILLNGRDLREYTLKSLRAQMGLVTQDTFLFNDTVANNIGYGSPGASREQVEDAARRAHAHDFILQMPQGYDTWIGERGVRLSGGQQQRLAIARAILRNPPILILDEATSALDTESERQVQAALNELMESRTVFVIAHRLSTIVHSDRILVLDHGRIAEQGSHEELLAHGGLYKRLYDLQFQV